MGKLEKKTSQYTIKVEAGLDDFEVLEELGKGAFGRVLKVKEKDTGNIFAMKVMKKKDIISNNFVSHTNVEREIMFDLSKHPFITELYYSFQTENLIFFVMKYVEGGSLFQFFTTRKEKLPEDHARFYAAQVLLALESMHDKNIIYRDLKLENILLDSNGYIRLSDFGLSAILNGNEKCKSFSGTAHYMSPEVLSDSNAKQGHGKSVDVWSFGVLLFVLLTFEFPFSSKNNNNQRLFEKIKKCKVDLKDYAFLSDESKNILQSLLVKEPSERLGCGEQGIKELKKHPFFSSVDWKKISQKKVKAPFIPPEMKGRSFADSELFTGADDPPVDSKLFQGFSFVANSNFTFNTNRNSGDKDTVKINHKIRIIKVEGIPDQYSQHNGKPAEAYISWQSSNEKGSCSSQPITSQSAVWKSKSGNSTIKFDNLFTRDKNSQTFNEKFPVKLFLHIDGQIKEVADCSINLSDYSTHLFDEPVTIKFSDSIQLTCRVQTTWKEFNSMKLAKAVENPTPDQLAQNQTLTLGNVTYLLESHKKSDKKPDQAQDSDRRANLLKMLDSNSSDSGKSDGIKTSRESSKDLRSSSKSLKEKISNTSKSLLKIRNRSSSSFSELNSGDEIPDKSDHKVEKRDSKRLSRTHSSKSLTDDEDHKEEEDNKATVHPALKKRRGHNTLKVLFQMKIQSMVEVPAQYNGKSLYISWKCGSKNSGKTRKAFCVDGKVDLSTDFEFTCKLYQSQQPPFTAQEKNLILVLKGEIKPDKPPSTIFKTMFNIAQYSENKEYPVVGVPMKGKTAVCIQFTTEWLCINDEIVSTKASLSSKHVLKKMLTSKKLQRTDSKEKLVERDLEKVKSLNESINVELNDLKLENQSLKGQLEKLDAFKDLLNEEVTKLKATNEEQETKLDQARSEVSDLKEKLEKSQKEVEDFQKQVNKLNDKLEKQITSFNEKEKKYLDDIQNLESKFKETQTQLEKQIHEKELEMKDLQFQNQSANQQLQLRLEEIKNLTTDLQNARQTSGNTQALQEKIEFMTTQLTESKEKINLKKLKLAANKEKLGTFNDQLNDKSNEIQELTKQVNDLIYNRNLEKDLHKNMLENEIKEKFELVESIKLKNSQQLQSLEQQLKLANQINDDREKQINFLQAEAASQRDQLQKFTEMNEQLTTQLKSIQDSLQQSARESEKEGEEGGSSSSHEIEMKLLLNQFELVKDQLKAEQANVLKVKEQSMQMKRDVENQLSESLAKQKQILKEFDEYKNTHEEKLSDLYIQVNTLNSQLRNKDLEISSVKDHHQNLNAKTEDTIRQLNNQLNEKVKEIDRLKEDLSSKDRLLDSQKYKITQSNDQTDKDKDKLQNLQIEYNDLHIQLRTKESEAKILEAQLREKEKIVENLNNKLENIKDQVNEKNAFIQHLEMKIQNGSISPRAIQNDQSPELKNKIEELELLLKDKERKIKELKGEITALEESGKLKDKKIEKLQQKQEKAEDSSDEDDSDDSSSDSSSDDDSDDSDDDEDQLKEKVQILKAEIDKLNSTIKKLKEEKKEEFWKSIEHLPHRDLIALIDKQQRKLDEKDEEIFQNIKQVKSLKKQVSNQSFTHSFSPINSDASHNDSQIVLKEKEIQRLKEQLKTSAVQINKIETQTSNFEFLLQNILFSSGNQWHHHSNLPILTMKIKEKLENFKDNDYENEEDELEDQLLFLTTLVKVLDQLIKRSKQNMKDLAYYFSSLSHLVVYLQNDFPFNQSIFPSKYYDITSSFIQIYKKKLKSTNQTEELFQSLITTSIDTLIYSMIKQIEPIAKDFFLTQNAAVFSQMEMNNNTDFFYNYVLDNFTEQFSKMMKVMDQNHFTEEFIQFLLEELILNINRSIFNEIIKKKSFCTATVGFNVKFAISHFISGVMEIKRGDLITKLIKANFNELTEVTNLFVIIPNGARDVKNEDDLSSMFPSLNVSQLRLLIDNFAPTMSSPEPIPKTIVNLVKRAYQNHPSPESLPLLLQKS